MKNITAPQGGSPTVPSRGADGENFPVASLLLPAALRPAVRSFYDVVRAADDFADDPSLSAEEKARQLDRMDAGLTGDPQGDPRARRLVAVLEETGRPGAERHARRMVAAFREDIAATPCRTWEDLLRSCRGSADPVGRFLLDLHGEGPQGHAASDALCTSLQILNHLQDMGEDRRRLGRVYLPVGWIEEAGGSLADLEAPALTPALRAAMDRALAGTAALLREASALPRLLRSRRLAAETSAILSLARALHARLQRGDPLARRIAPTRGDAGRAALAGALRLAGVGR
ncbi:squalene/phytoene synthase family protein [Pseudoroseicyclus tamaricis]|uniref:Squalene/phytoene synthase family protein n=1 Tax=Pseudoroseicyclus tamaricis TaxID=2705421 RepID=A0A6B2JWC7_9RHOB|nr:squalene/phytoene synthase family protein [Pseudoroseicyclus tamaricis]NDV02420.1 squalene/phytoene synthase family protein [Pseudoroseicyclus tamaricis]